MTSDAAVETILARLGRPAGRWEPVGPASGGVQAGTVTGGNSFHAELATVRVLKSRQVDQRSVHFVTFHGKLPHLGDTTVGFGYIYAIEHTDSGCRIIGEAGGGGDPPTRSRPWVNLAGGHANDHFWAGGEIERAGADIARVQLRFADGHVVEDDPPSDIALFIVNAHPSRRQQQSCCSIAVARRSPNIRASPTSDLEPYPDPVPDTTDERSGDDQRRLGALLELIHRADSPFTTVRATYRIWRHDERATAAWRAGIEGEKRRGASISMFGLSDSTPAPPEHEEILRVWRAGDRAREERQGGSRDGSYGVRVADLWWSWDDGNGASSNEDDPTVGSGVGEELAVMLDPTPLLSALKFVATGRSQVADRATITADATPRPSDPRRGLRSFELHELGSGADRYRLQVDAERGVLLEVVALRDGEPFHKITTVEITFDDPIPDERFHFDPPAGEEVRPIRGRPGPQRLSLPEAQQRAPFTVLIPERIPENWHVHCVFVEPSERPPWPAQVSLNYNSEDGHESVNISQCAANEKQSQYDELIRGDGWDKVVRDGITIGVTKPGSAGNQAQAHLERDGTFVFLMSETLGLEQLTSIAAGLKPAPSTSSI